MSLNSEFDESFPFKNTRLEGQIEGGAARDGFPIQNRPDVEVSIDIDATQPMPRFWVSLGDPLELRVTMVMATPHYDGKPRLAVCLVHRLGSQAVIRGYVRSEILNIQMGDHILAGRPQTLGTKKCFTKGAGSSGCSDAPPDIDNTHMIWDLDQAPIATFSHFT